MSAIASDLSPDIPPLDKHGFALQLRPVFEMLARARGMSSLEELADASGIPRSTFYDRLKKGNFTALDFIRIASALQVAVDTLYLSADEIMGALKTGSFSPLLSALDVCTGQGTLLDPDLEPLDFYSRPALASV